MVLPLENTSMVWGVTGPLGSGKSLVAVATAVDALLDRHTFVCSNIHLDLREVSLYCGYDVSKFYQYVDLMSDDFDPFKLPCGSPRGSRGVRVRCLVVLDECAEFFDQYSSSKDFRIQRFLSWLRHCSKRGQDVFLIVQNRDFLNKSLRLLCSRFVTCTNLSTVRLPLLHIRFLPNISVAVTFDRFGNRGGIPAKFLRQRFWGRFYDTAEQISTYTGFAPPSTASVKGSILPVWRFRAFLITAAYLVLVLLL